MRIVIAIAFFAGCGGAASERPAERPRAPAAAEPAPAPPSPSNVLLRADVDAVLDAGIPAFLSNVEMEADSEGGRFVGFRIVSFFPNDSRFADGPVQPDDVVLAVNGLAIERPEHLFRVWQELRVASALEIDLLRHGEPTRLSYPIE